MPKILAIGNSFSQDATCYLEPVARSAGEEWLVRNAYIGGCSLETHWGNALSGACAYEYQKDAQSLRMVSLEEALKAEDWDYVTLQQVSHLSGLPDTWVPYLDDLLAYVRQKAPRAEIVLHETWAYEFDSDHGGFVNYDRDRNRMHEAIVKTIRHYSETRGLHHIPVGEAVAKLRKRPEFDPERGGLRLTRDGFHLSYDYGRYLAALVWFAFFSQRPVTDVGFVPEGTAPGLSGLVRKCF